MWVAVDNSIGEVFHAQNVDQCIEDRFNLVGIR